MLNATLTNKTLQPRVFPAFYHGKCHVLCTSGTWTWRDGKFTWCSRRNSKIFIRLRWSRYVVDVPNVYSDSKVAPGDLRIGNC